MPRSDSFAKAPWVLTLAAVSIIVAALYLARSVLIPLSVAVLLSFLLAPLCDRLERWKLGRIPAVTITAMFAFLMLGAIGWTVFVQASDLAGQLPKYEDNVQAKLESFNGYVRGAITQITRTKHQIGQRLADAESSAESESGAPAERRYLVRLDQSDDTPLLLAGRLFGSLLELLGTAGIVAIFVIFFLLRREDLRNRFIRLVGRGKVTVTTQAIGDAADRISRYLATQLFVNAIYGTAVAIGLSFIGIPNAILWGLLGMALRFIPYIGAWIGASVPICLSFAISAGWTSPILTVALFLLLEFFSGNVLEPWLYGKHTGISPTAVLVAAVLWTWLWGPAGLLLATPLTVCLVVSGKHVSQLSFLNVLFGDEPVFEPKVNLYQRLLAHDQEEASEIVEKCLSEQSPVEICDSVLVPALIMSENDWNRGEIDESQHNYILQSFRDLIDELDEKQEAAVQEPAQSILCLPARDEADAIAATMLAQGLAHNGWHAESVSSAPLTSELLDLVADRQPAVLCISAVPPAAIPHARYLCKRVRARFPDVNMIVGLWTLSGDLSKARERIGGDDSIRVVATFAEAQEAARRLIDPLLIGAAATAQ